VRSNPAREQGGSFFRNEKVFSGKKYFQCNMAEILKTIFTGLLKLTASELTGSADVFSGVVGGVARYQTKSWSLNCGRIGRSILKL
jgi:hypothetical protein